MGVTPNRGYPYPDPTSPMLITEDLQALAEAYDTDLKNVQNTVHQKPMFRATASARQAYGSAATMTLRFDVLESNHGGVLFSDDTLMPQDTFKPAIPGIYHLTATASYPQWLAIEWVRLRLFSTFEIGGSSTNVMPNNADGNRTISTHSLYKFTGTGLGNPLSVILDTNAAGTRSVFPIFSRSLTAVLVSAT